ncbi:MAG: hypothetical protein V2I33_19120 [Kangiellaceae bacterium]|nr:hypothetical protein [Kangiellaceae bacterium]
MFERSESTGIELACLELLSDDQIQQLENHGEVKVNLKQSFKAPILTVLLIDAHIRGMEGLDTTWVLTEGFELSP